MKKNGTTTKGTTRWRCKDTTCGASDIKRRPDNHDRAMFRAFIHHATGKYSMTECAHHHGISRATLTRRFTTYWYIDIPNTPDPHRIYDQIFIDGTRTHAGKTIYQLARQLTKITDLDQAAAWMATLQEFDTVYGTYIEEKSLSIITGRYEYTHLRVRKAYRSLLWLKKNNWLFSYLQPPTPTDPRTTWASTTNTLEGGFNSPLKLLARYHRGRSGEKQRRMIEWWLYLHTEIPDDPHTIAEHFNWGRDALAKVTVTTTNPNTTDHETGRPALYDNAIGNEYNHNLGIQKGWIGT